MIYGIMGGLGNGRRILGNQRRRGGADARSPNSKASTLMPY